VEAGPGGGGGGGGGCDMFSMGLGVARAPSHVNCKREEQTEMVGGDAGVRLGVATASTVASLWTNASVLFYSRCGDEAYYCVANGPAFSMRPRPHLPLTKRGPLVGIVCL
jgi:hypothetical protein